MVISGAMEFRCPDVGCAFRVHARYYVEKQRFAPGICPNTGAAVHIVIAGTNDVVTGSRVLLKDTNGVLAGSIVPNDWPNPHVETETA